MCWNTAVHLNVASKVWLMSYTELDCSDAAGIRPGPVRRLLPAEEDLGCVKRQTTPRSSQHVRPDGRRSNVEADTRCHDSMLYLFSLPPEDPLWHLIGVVLTKVQTWIAWGSVLKNDNNLSQLEVYTLQEPKKKEESLKKKKKRNPRLVLTLITGQSGRLLLPHH